MFGNRDTSNRPSSEVTTREEYEVLFRRDLSDKAVIVANRNEEILSHAE
jgi:hypothetical protein